MTHLAAWPVLACSFVATLGALARDWDKHQVGLMKWQRELLRE